MTQRAFLVGFIGLCIYVIVLFNDLPAFSILTWLSISILVSSGGVALLSLQGLQCRWSVGKSVATESALSEQAAKEGGQIEGGPSSGDASVEVVLGNFGTLNKAGLLLDVGLRHAGGARLTRRFLIEALPAGSTIAFPLTLRHLARGRYRVEELRIVGSDVLGLFRATLRVNEPGVKLKKPWWKFGRRAESKVRESAGRESAGRSSENRVKTPVDWRRVRIEAAIGAVAISVLGASVWMLFQFSRLSGAMVAAASVGCFLSLCLLSSRARNWRRRRDIARDALGDREGDGGRRILIGPATIAGQGVSSDARREGGSGATRRLPVRGEEIRGTRPYVAGDDLRIVHWKSTARLGRLVVKEFQPDAQSHCVVIWDGAAPPDTSSRNAATGKARPRAQIASSGGTTDAAGGNDPQHMDAIENGLRLAASLCRALGQSGQACALWRLDAAPRRATSAEFTASAIPANANPANAIPSISDLETNETVSQDISDGETPAVASAASFSLAPFAMRCAEVLADARADRTLPLTLALSTHVRDMARGSAVYLVTPSLSNDVRAAVAALQRRGLRVAVALTNETTNAASLRNTQASAKDVSAKDVSATDVSVKGVPDDSPSEILPGVQIVSLWRERDESLTNGKSRNKSELRDKIKLQESLETVRRALDELLGQSESESQSRAADLDVHTLREEKEGFSIRGVSL